MATEFESVRATQLRFTALRIALSVITLTGISIPLVVPFYKLGITLDTSLMITFACFGIGTISGGGLAASTAAHPLARVGLALAGAAITSAIAVAAWIAAAFVLPYP